MCSNAEHINIKANFLLQRCHSDTEYKLFCLFGKKGMHERSQRLENIFLGRQLLIP